MKTSENGILFIKANEGYLNAPRIDNGKLAWGYGHDQQPGEVAPISISLGVADALLRADLPRYEVHVNELAPWANQNQYDSLVDFCYNLGPVPLATMLHHGQDQVPVQMPAWHFEHVRGVVVESPELLERRAAEVALFQTPDSAPQQG